MAIKSLLVRTVEKITGRKCSRCRYNRAGRCAHPSDGMYAKCWHSMTRPGFKERPITLGKIKTMESDGQGIKFTVDTTGLSEEERHLLEKIKAALAEEIELYRSKIDHLQKRLQKRNTGELHTSVAIRLKHICCGCGLDKNWNVYIAAQKPEKGYYRTSIQDIDLEQCPKCGSAGGKILFYAEQMVEL